MKLKKVLSWLIFSASVSPVAFAGSAQTLSAQSYVSGISTPDQTAAVAALNASASTASKVQSSALPITKFRSLRGVQQTQGLQAAGAVAAPVAGCVDIQAGVVYSANTPPTGQLYCFEFVAADATKTVANIVNLPANEQHNAYLYQANADGSFTLLDIEQDSSPQKIVETVAPGPVRLLLMVDSQTGAGGSQFLFQVNGTTGYDQYEPNDSVLHPTQLSGNQQINGNLDTASDVDYYAITVPTTQTSNLINFTGVGTQTAELQVSPNSWATLQSANSYVVSSSAGATLMMRVRNTSTTAPAAQTYSLHLSDGNGTAGIYKFTDTENISNLVPNRVNVARTVTVGAAAWDSTGNVKLPRNEHITIQAYDRDANGNLVLTGQASGYTDASGNFLTALNVGVCQGGGTQTQTFHTISTPSDSWSITWNPNAFVVALMDNGKSSPSSSFTYFNHICTENYLGRS